MRAVSGDLVLKLAIGAALLGAAWWAVQRVKAALEVMVADVAIPDVVNPASPDNAVNQVVTAVGDAIVSPSGPGRNADGSWTLGGMLNDLFGPGAQVRAQAQAEARARVEAVDTVSEWERHSTLGVAP